MLHELFTGVFPFTARTLGEWQQAHQQTPPRSPLEYVPSLDPAIERLILACLEKEPAPRPPSSRFVLAGLLRPVAPTWLPPRFGSERAAWIGTSPIIPIYRCASKLRLCAGVRCGSGAAHCTSTVAGVLRSMPEPRLTACHTNRHDHGIAGLRIGRRVAA